MSEADESWKSHAACIGMSHLFFPDHICWTDCPPECQAGRREPGRFERIRRAREVCDSCPVEQECLEWALETRFPVGFVGGKSERERKLLLRARAAGEIVI